MHTLIQPIVLLLLLLSPTVSAEIYRWVDENGNIQFSDSPPEQEDVSEVEVDINTYEYIDQGDIEYYQPPQKASRQKVVMYATSWCGYCAKARKYFNQKGIRFLEYDIEKDKRAKKRYDAIGGSGVPVIFIGKQRMNGFSVGGFERRYYGTQ